MQLEDEFKNIFDKISVQSLHQASRILGVSKKDTAYIGNVLIKAYDLPIVKNLISNDKKFC